MVYFDNAATSGHKPEKVVDSVEQALHELSANPGRSGHAASVRASEMVFATRQKVAALFGCPQEERVIFTPSCTYALNFAIKGIMQTGDHIITSSIEHNAVARPVEALRRLGAEVDIAEVIFSDPEATVRSFERLIRHNTKAIICTHASNVTGEIMPIEQIGQLCQKHSILLIVDAAQSAGILPIDMQSMHIDFLCIAPHKGLYAPMGCGILLARQDIPYTIIEGGTGVASALPTQPQEYPERMESGTLNLPGIAGISAGIDFVQQKGMRQIYEAELRLIRQLYEAIVTMGGIQLYTPYPAMDQFTPVLSFNVRGMSSSESAERLDKMGIAVRPGLHCAPSIHKRLGTIESGTVRVSTSVFNTEKEMRYMIHCLQKIVTDIRQSVTFR